MSDFDADKAVEEAVIQALISKITTNNGLTKKQIERVENELKKINTFLLKINKKELTFLERVTKFTQLDDAFIAQYKVMAKSPNPSEIELKNSINQLNKHLDTVEKLVGEAMERNDDISNAIFKDLMARSNESRGRIVSIESQIRKNKAPEAAEAPLPIEIQQQLDNLDAEYQATKSELLNMQEKDDLLDKIEIGVKEIKHFDIEKNEAQSARGSLDIELEKAQKELKALEAEFKQSHPEMYRKPTAAIYQKIEQDKLKSDKPSRYFTPHKVSRAGQSGLLNQQKTEGQEIKKAKKRSNKPLGE